MAHFKNVHWMPAPRLSRSRDASKVYMSFNECYVNEVPNDSARPGKKASAVNEELPQPDDSWNCKLQTARVVVWCSDCEKPRLLFSKIALDFDDKASLERALEECPFVCGTPLFVGDDHGMSDRVMQHHATCCALNIDAKFYKSEKLPGFKWVCSVCLDGNISEKAEEDESYTGLPRCNNCQMEGMVRQSGKKTSGPRRKRGPYKKRARVV